MISTNPPFPASSCNIYSRIASALKSMKGHECPCMTSRGDTGGAGPNSLANEIEIGRKS
jgi:hypothetical protein